MSSLNRTALRTAEVLLTISAALALGAVLVPARATDVCGAVCDTTWTAAGGPYVATCDVTVALGCSLTIEAGVEVRFTHNATLAVGGVLDVNGVPASRVRFVSNASPQNPGDWSAVVFEGVALGYLDDLDVRHATYGIYVSDGATVQMNRVTLTENLEGLHVEGESSPTVTATDCSITANSGNGVQVYETVTGTSVTITRSAIHGNLGLWDFNARSPMDDNSGSVIHARENWWGTTDSVQIGSRIYDNRRYGHAPKVDWCAYLDGPGGSPRAVHCPDLRVESGEAEVWDQTDAPYLLTGTMSVEPGGSLRIEAGVQLLAPAMEDRAAIVSDGNVEIAGTESSPVVLTTEGVRFEQPYWIGLTVSHADATIEHMVIENAYHGAFFEGEGTATLHGVTMNSCYLGLQAYGGADVTATECTIVGSLVYGVDVQGNVTSPEGPATSLSLTSSSIHSGTGDYEVHVANFPEAQAQTVIDAKNNWWGTTDPPTIRDRIYDRVDDDTLPWVDWCRYLDGPGGVPVRDTHCPNPKICVGTTVWDQTDKPYLLTSDVKVCSAGTLTIGPGVEVQAIVDDPTLAVVVEGTLDVNGTGASPVTFSSASDVPMPGDWSGLRLRSASTSTIDHAEITYAERAVHLFEGASATLVGVTATQNQDGLYLYGNLNVDVSDSAFVQNQRYGVYAQGVSTLSDPIVWIRQSEIHTNGGAYDVYLDGGFSTPAETIFQAEDNWWGTTDRYVISARIRDRVDYSGNALVDWCAPLQSAGGAPAAVSCLDPDVCDETEILDRTDEPYLVISNIEICPTGTLQIGPGVELRVIGLSPSIRINVRGVLDVNGTTASPIVMTSDLASPQALDWRGISLMAGSTADLDHLTVEYADRGIEVLADAQVSLDGVISARSRYGLYVQGYGGPPTVDVTGSTFTENTYYGVYLSGNPNPDVTIANSSMFGNLGSYDLYTVGYTNPARTVLRMWDNFWGDADAERIGSRIHGQRRNTGAPVVDYCHYLDDAPPTGVRARDVHCPDLVACDAPVTWNLTDKPYQIVTDVRVCNGQTLTIGPGVEARVVNTTPQPDFRVEGILDVNGTEGSPVTLTSDAGVPQALDWQGLYLTTGSTSELDHLTLEYANKGIQAVSNAQVSLDGVTSARNRYGLSVEGYGGPPTVDVTGSTFTENTYYGIQLTGNPNPNVTVMNSSLFGNLGSYDLYTSLYANPTRTVMRMWDIFWGDADAERIGTRIHGQRRNTGSPVVDYCHYLDGPPPTGVRARDVHCPDLVACDAPVTWELTDKPYQIVTDVRVCNGQTLTIGSGVEARVVNTVPQPDFRVEGNLDVAGTEGAPVLLTSDAASPAALDWQGLYLTTGSTSQIEHATIEYADRGIEALSNAQVSLDGVTSARNRYGLYVQGYGGPPTVDATGSTFTENTYYGIQLTGNPNPNVTVVNSSLFGNLGSYDLYTSLYANPTRTVVRMWDNFWGDADAERIGSRIHGQRRNTGAPIVDYCHYLDDAPPTGVRARDVHCPDLVACDDAVTWDLTDKPYQIVTDVRVCNGQTLTIGPGVEARVVNTAPQPDFRVEGVLDVNGTHASPVLLTSDAEVPQPLDWQGLYLTTGSSIDLEHVTVEYATKGVETTGDADMRLDGVIARHNRYGLYVDGAGPPTARVKGSTFTENTYYGVYLNGNPNPDVTISTSSLHGNLSSYDLYTLGYASPATSIVWATDNWWGTTNTATIDSRIYDRSESTGSPRVYYRAFGEACDWALGGDRDGDGRPDFDDNCPVQPNATQLDADGDLMGDACDPEPALAPSGACDGTDDVLDGYLDADGDGWGDPCDHQPLRADSYPGAPELCDARDNDGDGAFGTDERVDEDFDGGILCGDCDDLEPLAHVCTCEVCNNVIDDDCDTLADGADAECALYGSCILLTAGTEPWLQMDKGVCGGATLTDPYDVIRGRLEDVQFSGGSVDLGTVSCVAGDHPWDRATDSSANLNPKCEGKPVLFYLAKNRPDADYGAASSGERREVMVPDPACP